MELNASGKILENKDAEGLVLNEMEQNIDKVNLGKYIKSQRTRKGLTQQELAEKVNLSTKSISCMERGLNYPSPENLFDIANVLEMSIDVFLFGYKKFNMPVNLGGLNETLEQLTKENQAILLNIIEAVSETLLLQQQAKENN